MKIFFILILSIVMFSCSEYNSNVTKNQEVYGVVQNKFINKLQQYEMSIKLTNGKKLGLFDWSNTDTTLYSCIEKGDSIVKRKGEYSLFVYKPNGKVKEFKYMDGKGKVYSNKE
jgi:hypothetical protein